MIGIDLSVPRYTSYPPAPHFGFIDEKTVLEHYRRIDEPLSLYVHIPFCRSMCLFCGCSVILNRKPDKQADYVEDLLKEIALVKSLFPSQRSVDQLHFGGGTPTSLSAEELSLILASMQSAFSFAEDAEISIEIDPRTVYADGGEKLFALRKMGFNRVSFGVQDLDPAVQEAVRRRQSEEMTIATYERARSLGFQGINIDLIYGLPQQTPESFGKTIDRIIGLRPDRLALFSYAHVPWIKEHQKALKDLPSQESKWEIYLAARKKLLAASYFAIGLDHFSLPDDPLTQAFHAKTLTRNFQGYSAKSAEPLIGFGVTSIGQVHGCYVQNVKTLSEYKEHLAQGKLPILRGYLLDADDTVRKWVIQSLMCQFEVDKSFFASRFHTPFDTYFSNELKTLQDTALTHNTQDILQVTEEGKLLIRLIASHFDAHLKRKEARYSKL